MSLTVTNEGTNTSASTVDVETTDESVTTEMLSKDTLFEILKNQRRRDALEYLKQNDGTAKLSDMAEYIAAKENGIEIAALSSSQRKRVYIGLYQCHLPKMASAGVIDFDKNRGTVEIQPEAEQLEAYLDGEGQAATTRAPSQSATKRNLAIAGGLGAGVVASLAGVPGFVLVPDAVWALVSTGALVAFTALEARRGVTTAN